MNNTAARRSEKRRMLMLAAIALVAIATIALVDVIFVYQGQISVSQTAPLKFLTGPNGNNPVRNIHRK
ncbi:hypothetical protein [Vulcanisaeta distributa]|uniref:Uncharacterized protein n=1 Tax=Vulcanisaeta distributa (strain DSM 14429 / JCM 11212 / NBRC 100878 / IC-017) TaxID=572478 RepID=E1QQH7_VULDI|nr:hypothetical protein [Vulcanisaeta distributa]ADN50472.1 hypothetical protein Vdis_1084 [Vulcanisaeta distributa DSM 14429]